MPEVVPPFPHTSAQKQGVLLWSLVMTQLEQGSSFLHPEKRPLVFLGVGACLAIFLAPFPFPLSLYIPLCPYCLSSKVQSPLPGIQGPPHGAALPLQLHLITIPSTYSLLLPKKDDFCPSLMLLLTLYPLPVLPSLCTLLVEFLKLPFLS